jgi:SWI/SNF-related matrix-associated actin-dependent regulator of chromatin subfamily D
VYVYNTFKPATASAVSETPHGEKTEVDPASWTLHVQGRLLKPGEPGTVDAAPIRPGSETRVSTDPEAPKFGGFLRRLSVKIRGERNEESEHAWDASLADPLAPLPDGFEIKRVGETDARVSIEMEMHHDPPRVTLTPSLERLLGVASATTKPKLIRLLWRYVEARDLHARDDAASVTLDDALAAAVAECFAETTAETSANPSNDDDDEFSKSAKSGNVVPFATLARFVCAARTRPEPPISFEYVARTRGRKNPTAPECYDILVDVPLGGSDFVAGAGAVDANTGKRLNGRVPPTKNHPFVDRAVEADVAEASRCDARARAGVAKIAAHARRREFLLGFANNPGAFIDRVVAAQARDVPVARGDGSTNRRAERGAETYKQPWLDEAATRYVAGLKSAGGGKRKP